MLHKPSSANKPRATSGKTTRDNTITMRAASDTRPGQPNPDELYERIRIRAYELYEERGRQHGFDRDDWLRAEAEMINLLSRSA